MGNNMGCKMGVVGGFNGQLQSGLIRVVWASA